MVDTWASQVFSSDETACILWLHRAEQRVLALPPWHVPTVTAAIPSSLPPAQVQPQCHCGPGAEGIQASRRMWMVSAGPGWVQCQGRRGFPGKALRTSPVKSPEHSCAPESPWSTYLGSSVRFAYCLREKDFFQGHVIDEENGLRMKENRFILNIRKKLFPGRV